MQKPLFIPLVAALLLSAAPAWAEKGIVEITSEPGGAKIFINGQRKGSTSAQPGKALALELEEGEYTIEAKTDDGATAKQDVFVPANGIQPAHFALIGAATYTDPKTGMEFVKIPKGCFQMGSPAGESDRESREGPVHEVCVESFYLGKYEVTQAQWEKVMGNNPSNFKGANKPVEKVSWNDAQEFIGKLGGDYRLPIRINLSHHNFFVVYQMVKMALQMVCAMRVVC